MISIERVLLVFAATILGAILGSFIATLCLRWPRGEGVSAGRSRCDHCGTQLAAHDLIPIVSALRNKGRCGQCGGRIDPFHRRVELAAAGIGGLSLIAGTFSEGAPLAIFGWLLLPLLLLDWRYLWLPNHLTVLLAAVGVIAGGMLMGASLEARLIGGLVGFGSLFLLGEFYRRARGRVGLGAGDPKLFGAIGLWLGWAALPLVLLGAGLMGLTFALIRRRTLTASSQLPLGAALAATAWLLAAIAIHR